MNQPAQRHGDSVKTMAFTRSVNFRQGIEIGVVHIAIAIQFALSSGAVETRAGSYRSAIGKIPAESTAGQRIVSMEADAIVAEAFEQFRFNRTRDRVVQSLVDARPYPSMARGYFPCLRHLPRAEIADAELLKQAFVMKFLDARQRRFDRRGAVRRHRIEDLDLIGLLARQGLLEDSLQVLRFVAASV